MATNLYFKDDMKNKWLLILLLSIPLIIILVVSAIGYIQDLDISPNSIPKIKDSSQIYQESMPSIVKILEYSGWELHLPDYEYDETLDKFLPIPGGMNIIGHEDYGLWAIEPSVQNSPTSYGSGFIIGEDGYILTNAHVISNGDVWEENLKTELTLYDLLILEEEFYLGNIDEETYNYYIYLNNYLYEYIEITSNIRYEVVVGMEDIYVPEIIETEGGTFESLIDWSLIKINAENLKYLKTSDSNNVMEGAEILVVGYPGVSEKDSSETIEFKNDIKPTINSGIVSHIKNEGGHKTFQIDASASSGNSGGPVLNKEGKVIGILTSGIDEYDGGIYNYAQRISDILPKISSYVK